jgi:multiple sugar transport system substrate-binding protein
MPASPAGSEFKTAWQNGVNRVLSGEQQPADALRQAQQEAQRALDAAVAHR